MALAGRARAPASIAELAPLFLVSMATVGFEIALTRYFAVAKWSIASMLAPFRTEKHTLQCSRADLIMQLFLRTMRILGLDF